MKTGQEFPIDLFQPLQGLKLWGKNTEIRRKKTVYMYVWTKKGCVQ